jgi:hypothetical protein
MGIISNIAGLPVTGPLLGLGWLARRIAEAAEREMNDPARVERALIALERALDAGEIDEPAFEAREAELLAELDDITRATRADTETWSTPGPVSGDGPGAGGSEGGPEGGGATNTSVKTGKGPIADAGAPETGDAP